MAKSWKWRTKNAIVNIVVEPYFSEYCWRKSCLVVFLLFEHLDFKTIFWLFLHTWKHDHSWVFRWTFFLDHSQLFHKLNCSAPLIEIPSPGWKEKNTTKNQDHLFEGDGLSAVLAIFISRIKHHRELFKANNLFLLKKCKRERKLSGDFSFLALPSVWHISSSDFFVSICAYMCF